MSTDEYAPSEEEMYQAYRRNRPLDHHQDVEAAFDRFLARVRRDAAREAEARIQAVEDVLAAWHVEPGESGLADDLLRALNT